MVTVVSSGTDLLKLVESYMEDGLEMVGHLVVTLGRLCTITVTFI